MHGFLTKCYTFSLFQSEGSEGVLATEGSDSLRRRVESAGVSAYLW